MKTKDLALRLAFAACAGLVLLASSSALAQKLFVSDYSNGRIYEIATNGARKVFARDMDYPYGIAFDSAGHLFVANSANDAGNEGDLTKISSRGKQSVFYDELDPKGVAIDGTGNVFEADYHSGIIYEYSPDGEQSTFATDFAAPQSLVFDSAGNLFVADGYGNGNGRITKITPDRKKSLIASGLSFPSIAFDRAGNLFAANQGNGFIYEYAPDGTQSTFATVGGTNGDNNALAFDRAGNLFVATGAGPIVKITPDGTQSTFATLPGSPVGLAFQPPLKPSLLIWFVLGAVMLLVIGVVMFFVSRRKRGESAVISYQ